MIESIRGIRKKEYRIKVLVNWVGFEDNNNEIWKQFDETREDMPGMMKEFLYSAGDCKIKRQVLDLYYQPISVTLQL